MAKTKVAMKRMLNSDKKSLRKHLFRNAPQVYNILHSSTNTMDARMRLSTYLNNMENQFFNLFSDQTDETVNLAQRNVAKESIRVLRNVIRVENERHAGFSALEALFQIAKNQPGALEKVSEGFLCEFIFLFMGLRGQSFKRLAVDHSFRDLEGREAALVRSKQLNHYSSEMNRYFERYKKGTNPKLVRRAKDLQKSILAHYKIGKDEWQDFRWHLAHVIKTREEIERFVKLEKDEIRGLDLAEKYEIDVHITPYYLSLFNKRGRCDEDRAIRAQVIPSEHYCTEVHRNRTRGSDLDFMGEKSTSPCDCITRRYPQILILKPFDACPQICVYCQRNWEIKDVDDACVSTSKVDDAIEFISKKTNVTEVLLTGGDPFTLGTEELDSIIGKVCEVSHVERIRIGTRMLVTLPSRIDDALCTMLAKYHDLGTREICIVTHFEHPTEVTPDVVQACKRIRQLGISIYNQQVFTYFNSRKFETCQLRKTLKLCGIDPYYNFNTKGKEETRDFRVPIARIEQEMKEEARLLPGLTRTDEPVFNVPKLGKSHLRAWQDHEPVMIDAEGHRIFRFYPWESNLVDMGSYFYRDVSIYDYLQRLVEDGEDVEEYGSIWFYF